MIHGEHIGLYEAKAALQENVKSLKPDTHPILHNQNIALLGICHSLENLERDVALLHSKLQPVLKAIGDDEAEWREQVRKGG
jgi:hypothetical protein